MCTFILFLHVSPRYWLSAGYEERLRNGQEPQNIDKEFLRRWFVERCDPYKDETLPEVPPELTCELSRRYVAISLVVPAFLARFLFHVSKEHSVIFEKKETKSTSFTCTGLCVEHNHQLTFVLLLCRIISRMKNCVNIRYILLYELITGSKFAFPSPEAAGSAQTPDEELFEALRKARAAGKIHC